MSKKSKKNKRTKEIINVKTDKTFFNYLLEKEQKKRLSIIVLFYIFAYFILTYLYPFPHETTDSIGYVLSAYKNEYLTYRPFGYSKILIYLHSILKSISFVVLVQYCLNAISTIFFIFTIKYFFRPKNKIYEIIFEILSVCSISVLFLTNCILSDSLFASLTILWIAFGIWFIFTAKTIHKVIIFVIHVALLGLLFTVRYTAVFYVLITLIITFMTYFRQYKVKVLGFLAVPILLIYILYNHQVAVVKELTGVKTFSAFTGWQMANNALHVLPHINLDIDNIDNEEVKQFSYLITTYDTLPILPKYNTSAEFIWANNLPLKKYLFYQIKLKGTGYLVEYTYLGENVYSKFAINIMKEHPLAYFRYFIFPNTLGILYPRSDDVCTEYNGSFISQDLLQNWFEIDNDTTFYSRSTIIEKVSKLLPIYMLIVWIIMFSVILFNLIKFIKLKWSPVQTKIYYSVVCFVICYFVFHAFAAPFFIRFLAPIHILQITIIYIVLNYHKIKHKSDS